MPESAPTMYRGVQIDAHAGGKVTLRPVQGEAMRVFHAAWDLVPLEERPAAFVVRGSIEDAKAAVDKILTGRVKLYLDDDGPQMVGDD